LLHAAEEELAAALGSAAIAAKRDFVEVIGQVLVGHRPWDAILPHIGNLNMRSKN
jgi:hypothetical protein